MAGSVTFSAKVRYRRNPQTGKVLSIPGVAEENGLLVVETGSNEFRRCGSRPRIDKIGRVATVSEERLEAKTPKELDRAMRLFSQRYAEAIDRSRITVELASDVRKKLWVWLRHLDGTVRVQQDPDDNWTTNSTVLLEVQDELKRQYGQDDSPDVMDAAVESGRTTETLRQIVMEGPGYHVLDVVELTYNEMWDGRRDKFREEVNKIFDIHKCPWRLSDGECFMLNGDFVGARLVEIGSEALASNNFDGAADEYAKAQRELASGETKGAIFYAGKSFESVLKVLTGKNNGNARILLREMVSQRYFDDLPEQARQGFSDQVMMAIPFLRNKFGGHGQGESVVDVSKEYGTLAVEITAAFHNFLIAKHLDKPRNEVSEDEAEIESVRPSVYD